MKVPSIFVPEKDLEKKIFQLTEKSSEKKTSQPEGNTTRKPKIDVEQYYWKFVNIAKNKKLTLENIKNCLKDLTDEEASEVFNYGRREKERYLEYLMYR